MKIFHWNYSTISTTIPIIVSRLWLALIFDAGAWKPPFLQEVQPFFRAVHFSKALESQKKKQHFLYTNKNENQINLLITTK